MDKTGRYHELLLSLGVALYGEHPVKPIDPEMAIIELAGTFYDDQKFFRLLLAWLSEAGELVHVERLKTLSRDLEPSQALVVAAIALKQVRRGDRRWHIVAKHHQKRLRRLKTRIALPEGYDSEYLISKKRVDPDFEKLGLKIALIEPEERKKILSVEGILKANRWLKFRAMIGANFRADIAFLISEKLALNPNQAAKQINCSRETAYRLWKWVALSQ